MTELKVTSKKYNDKDVLEIDNLKEAVKEVLSGELGNIDVSEVPQLDGIYEISAEDYAKIEGKIFCDIDEVALYYPAHTVENYMWISFSHIDDGYLIYLKLEEQEDGSYIGETNSVDLGGTKLYRHVIDMDGEVFECICDIAQSFATRPDLISPVYIGYNGSNNTVAYMKYDAESQSSFILENAVGEAIVQSETITDTVTPL